MRRWVAVILFFGAFLTSVPAAENSANESKLHSVIAAMITKISSYATWSGNGYAKDQTTVTVAVYTVSRETLSTFENVINGKISGGKQWQVKQVHSLEEAAQYQFVFFDDEAPDPDYDWYKSAGEKGVLTFSCKEDKRAIFNFILVNGKVNFDIHIELSQLAQVKFDSRLLKLARRMVRDEGQ